MSDTPKCRMCGGTRTITLSNPDERTLTAPCIECCGAPPLPAGLDFEAAFKAGWENPNQPKSPGSGWPTMNMGAYNAELDRQLQVRIAAARREERERLYRANCSYCDLGWPMDAKTPTEFHVSPDAYHRECNGPQFVKCASRKLREAR